jgi:hypothetical protein
MTRCSCEVVKWVRGALRFCALELRQRCGACMLDSAQSVLRIETGRCTLGFSVNNGSQSFEHVSYTSDGYRDRAKRAACGYETGCSPAHSAPISLHQTLMNAACMNAACILYAFEMLTKAVVPRGNVAPMVGDVATYAAPLAGMRGDMLPS